MNRIQVLEKKVRDIYEARNPDRADWADWLYGNHVFLVADMSLKLSERFSGNSELSQAAAMLHDIADAVMSRFDSDHGDESFKIAQHLLGESGFTDKEINVIVDDAIRLHACHGEVPETLEGKIMATADAVVHLESDFYKFGLNEMKKDTSIEKIKQWALPKIDRDFYNKIQFDEIRKEVKDVYEEKKEMFLKL